LIVSPKLTEVQVYNAISFAKEIITIFEEDVKVTECKYCPDILKGLRLIQDGGRVKVFSTS